MRERAFYVWLRHKYPDLNLSDSQKRVVHALMHVDSGPGYSFLLALLEIFNKEFPDPTKVFERIGLR